MLGALILVEAVANLNLSVANTALPDIGRAFDASQTELTLISVAYSLGLAASVLYLGAVGDRYGRKQMLMLGMAISIPASVVAAMADDTVTMIAGRLIGGVAAGMAYPTTLALITALWSGAARTRSIALWSAAGGAMTALGPIVSGGLLEWFTWPSVFIVTIPLALAALAMSWREVPSHVNENDDPVDHRGGLLSAVMVASLVLAINFSTFPGSRTAAVALLGIALVSGALFFKRQRRVPEPLFDLEYARRPIFWVAATAGIIVFGSLMGAMFVGQQYLQNVLGYSTLASGAAIIPGAVAMALVAPRSAKLVGSRGSRWVLLTGYGFCALGFASMLALWTTGAEYWQVGLSFLLMGTGVGLAGTPASHALTGALPVRRVGMASGTADLQRDLGGAIIQSIFGALLTAGYANAFSRAIASSPQASGVSPEVESTLEKSFAGAEVVAERYPQYSTAIIDAARTSFEQGQTWAYVVGLLAVGLGSALVWRFFPARDEEARLLGEYAKEDDDGGGGGSDEAGA